MDLNREQSGKRIAANVLLTLLRSSALVLNIRPMMGLKVIDHNSAVIRSLQSQINVDSIV